MPGEMTVSQPVPVPESLCPGGWRLTSLSAQELEGQELMSVGAVTCTDLCSCLLVQELGSAANRRDQDILLSLLVK